MITEAFCKVVAGLFSALGSLFGVIPVPSWFASLHTDLASLATSAAGVTDWIPISDGLSALGFWAGCLGVALTIRVVRIVASFLTAGGGSAA